MSYEQMARLEVLNAVSGIKTKEELDDFKNMLAKYFADKAQKAIDALCSQTFLIPTASCRFYPQVANYVNGKLHERDDNNQFIK